MSDFQIQTVSKKSYPALKMPNPSFNFHFLKMGKPTGLLSRVERKERVGVEQVVVNELSKQGDTPHAYGIVKIGPGKRIAGISRIPKDVVEGIDEFTIREFQGLRDFWFHPFELVRAFKPSIELKRPVAGRRFASEIDLERDRKKRDSSEEVDIPEELLRFSLTEKNAPRPVHEGQPLREPVSGEEFVLAVPGMARPWVIFPLRAAMEKDAVEEAGEILKSRRATVGFVAQRAGDLLDKSPVFMAKTRLHVTMAAPSEIEEILSLSPDDLKEGSLQTLMGLYSFLHEFHVEHFADTDKATTDGVSREDLVNAYIFLLEELKRRGKIPKPKDELDSEARDLVPEIFTAKDEPVREIEPGGCARTESSGEKKGERIHLREVLEKVKPFRYRQDAVSIVGGLANHGFTDNDIDVLIKGPIDENTLHVLKFRIGRMLGPKLGSRVQFLDDTMGGPFTNHIPLGNLVFETNSDLAVKEMQDLGKADDPLQDLPEKPGKRQAVFQLHFRGKSAHGDIRFKINDHLVGWTTMLQKPGAIKEPVTTLEEGRAIARGFDVENGNPYLKPFLAPKGVSATAKSRQPEVWLDIGDEVYKPGSVGATKNFPAVFIEMERPKVEFGRQSPRFHEYFLTDGKILKGILTFRQLVSEGEEIGGTPEGEPFWKMSLSKNYLPSVLRRRTVRRKVMPPDGYSWLPKSLEKAVPKEFRYWEKKGEEARKLRDALVETRLFTEDTVKLIGNEFRLVEKTEKQTKTVDYTLSRQSFRGPIQVRAGFSKVFWWLVLDRPNEKGVRAWKLQTDPKSGEARISAIEPKPSQIDDKDLLKLEGDVRPGSRFNDTKNTPSSIKIVGRGKVDLLDEQGGFLKVRFKSGPLKGIYVLESEEEGSKIWEFSSSKHPGEAAKSEESFVPPKGVQEEAKLGLKLRSEFNRGGTEIGVARARDLSNRRAISIDTIRRMRSYFARHEVDSKADGWKDRKKPSAGWIAWLLWGGDSGRRWAERIWEQHGVDKATVPVEDGRQVWDPEKKREGADRRQLKPLALFTPMKPSKGFFAFDDFARDWVTPEYLRGGIGVEAKWNGLRVIAQHDGEKPLIYFEDSKEDRSKILPGVAEELNALAKKVGPFILDGELVDEDGEGNVLPRRTLSRFTGPVKPQDDRNVRLQIFHDLFSDSENFVALPYDEMRSKLERFFKKAGELKHLRLAPTKIAKSQDELAKAVQWAQKIPGSEGAMFKLLDSTYTLGGRTSSWAKLKTVRELNAIVTEKILKKPSPKQKAPSQTWVYKAAVGPVPEKDLDSIGRIVEVDGKPYAYIGKTFATNIKANPGDVLKVQFTEILVDLTKDKKTVNWFTPVVVEKIDEAPNSFDDAVSIAFEHEIKKFVDKLLEKRLAIIKGEEETEERIVYGIVLEPEVRDAQDDIYSAEEIRRAAHLFMEEFRHLGAMHRVRLDGRLKILESYIATQDLTINGEHVKKGTWLMVIRVKDDAMWKAVKQGKLTGLSIGGSAIRKPEK